MCKKIRSDSKCCNSNETTGQPICNSGVTLGIGVDLGQNDVISLGLDQSNPVDNAIIQKIQQFLQVTKYSTPTDVVELYSQAKSSLASLTEDEVDQLSLASVKVRYQILASEYNKNCKNCNVTNFDHLPCGIRTALFSFFYNQGSISSLDSKVYSNDWTGVVEILRGMQTDAVLGARRMAEADIIEACYTVKETTNIPELVFVVDESGSIGTSNFTLMKNFLKSYIGNDTTSTSHIISPEGKSLISIIFFDSAHNLTLSLGQNVSKSDIINFVDSYPYNGGSTNAGAAVTFALKQFSHSSNGKRAKIIVLVTDGEATDDLTTAANKAREEGVIIVCIGVGKSLDLGQLKRAAYIEDYVYLLAQYVQLETILGQIKSAASYSPVPVASNTSYNTTASGFGNLAYYQSFVPINQNFKINVEVLGGTLKIYLSLTISTPDPASCSVQHTGGGGSTKEVVIATPVTASARRVLADVTNYSEYELRQETMVQYTNPTYNSTHYIVYYSIEGQNGTNYSIKVVSCDPSVCKEGTNDSSIKPGGIVAAVLIPGILFGALIVGSIIHLRRKKKMENRAPQKKAEVELKIDDISPVEDPSIGPVEDASPSKIISSRNL